MITFFRRVINSKVGLILAFVLLGVIAVGFAATDVQNLMGGGQRVATGSVAEVAGQQVTASELQTRVQQQLANQRQQVPGLDIATYVGAGGVENTLDRLVNGLALQLFGERAGMRASDRAIEGQIASIQAFQGPTGKFDETTFRAALAQQRVTEAELRGDIAREAIASQLIGPVIGASQVPAQLATPYAALLLERRSGQFGLIPAASLPAGAPPTPQEIQTFYQRNIARFTIPQRRVLRYATFDASRVAGRAAPTEAEIAQAYRAAGNRFAARETRDLTQVIVADQAGANAIAAKVRGGATVAAAAQGAGLEASRVTGSDKAGFAAQSSPALADAAYAATQGSVVGPIRSPLGWHVIRVEEVTAIPARTLDAAREELTAELTRSKAQSAMADFVAAIEDSAADGANIAEIAKQQGLTLVTTPPLLPNGRALDAADAAPAPALAAIVQPAFEAEQGDDPQVSALGQQAPGAAPAGYILWALDSIVAPTPRPLASVNDAIVEALVRERRQRAARQIARQVSAAVAKGTPLAQALASSNAPGSRVERISGTRAELTAGQQRPDPARALMFSLAAGSARYIEMPGDAGYIVVKVDSIVPGDIRTAPQVVAATRGGLSRVIGQEYAAQFVNAIRGSVGTQIDTGAVAALKRQLTGQGQ